jgi:hypothetical protein
MSAYLFEIYDKGILETSDHENILYREALFSASGSATFYRCIAYGIIDECHCLSGAALVVP